MFKIKNLNVSINNKDILKNLNFNIRKGELHALIGPNGSGKTTLIDVISGLLTAEKGEILIDDTYLNELINGILVHLKLKLTI